MGALPNYQPKPEKTRKPAGRAKKLKDAERCSPRTPQATSAELRARTNYDKGTGYFPLFHAFWEDVKRLSSGLSCTNLVITVYQHLSMGSSGTHAVKEHADFSVSEMAASVLCDERQVNRVLEYLVARGMAGIERLEGGRFLIALKFKDWGKITQSYEEWDLARRQAEAAQENPQDETNEESEDFSVKTGTVPLTKSPVAVKAGQQSKPIKVNTGVRSLRIHWESKVLDLTFQAVVTSGELILTGTVPEESLLKSKQDAKPEESTRSRHSSGHGSPNGREIPHNAGRRSSPHSGGVKTTPVEVDHARAAELAAIFNPLIFNHCKQTLSGDPRFHLQACEAIGDTPHDDIVKAAVDRGARVLRPSHIPSLCQQIRHDWEAGKSMPAKAKGKSSKAPFTDPSKIEKYDPLWWQKEKRERGE
jgi:hypothetical protein